MSAKPTQSTEHDLLTTLDELPPGIDPFSVPAKIDSNSAKQRTGPGGSSFATLLRLNEWEEVMRDGGNAGALLSEKAAATSASSS